MSESLDLIVIGGGPGGYVAAIRAAQLGLKTVCVEREKLGGICLNWGCIPTKALLRSAEVLDLCRRADEFGVKIEGTVSFDFAAVMKRSRKIAEAQEKGIAFLFKKYKVGHVAGTARLANGHVVVKSVDGAETTLEAKDVIVATGARAKSLPGVTIDGERIIEYRGALSLPTLPAKMAIIGAGAIGVEFASFYRALGVEITLIEYLPQLVPIEDEEVAQALLASFKKRGIRCLVGHQVTSAVATGQGVIVSVVDRADATKTEEVAVDVALVATGITANVEGLGLEEAGVKMERGFIVADDVTQATAAAGIFAIGDVTGPPALAHVASAEAVSCVERIAGHSAEPIDYESIPGCTFCHPEIASIGLTEKAARAAGHDIKVGHFPFRALGKARAAGEVEGFVKVIHAASDGRILGAHIIGAGAPDLIAEYGLAKSTEVNSASLMHTVHAHPTLAEALREATEEAYGRSVHI